MSRRKVGVYICHCGGNISDHVDVDRIKAEIEKDSDVVVSRTTMFTCSDASQTEMMNDIRENGLDGIVVASCSPKLHLSTFRGVADRAGMNPFQYVQVNIREQCSWAHSDDPAGATDKAVGLVRGGLGKAKLAEPLEPIRVNSIKKVLVIGAGIAGLRAAIELADLGVEVFVVEKRGKAGGTVGNLGRMYPSGRVGSEIISALMDEVAKRPLITLFTGAGLARKEGYIGNFDVGIRTGVPEGAGGAISHSGPAVPGAKETGDATIDLKVGAIIVATGAESYVPAANEFGYGLDGVVTLPEFERMVNEAGGEKLIHGGREIRTISFIYCVGSRQHGGDEGSNTYCSRYCCNAAVHASTLAMEKFEGIDTYHLYRDMRTYGKFETLYEKASLSGAVFVRFADDDPPSVASRDGGLVVTARDLLTCGEEIEIPSDLVVLVTGMVAAENAGLTSMLKLPLGADRFYNEIHAKLRPVETVIDGVYIGGCCNAPRNSTESVISSLSAVAKAASLLVKGYVDLQPFVAFVKEDLCSWCGACESACPYSAISMVEKDGRRVATVNEVLCKGCGACVPVCLSDATQLKGYTDEQIFSMIDAFSGEVGVG